MTRKRDKRKRPEPIRKDEYGGRAANIAGFVVMGVFAALALLSIFRVRIQFPSIPLPAQFDSIGARMILGVVGIFLAFILLAFAIKWFEARRAATWASVAGRITRSRRAESELRGIGDPYSVRPIDIEFEYVVDGVQYAGGRVSLAERIAESNVDALLARYPVGARVTVHYDPKDPADSVLERNYFGGATATPIRIGPPPVKVPTGQARGCLIATGLGIAVMLVVMRIVTEGPDAAYPCLRAALPEANFPLMFFLLVFALGFGGPAFIWGRLVLKVRSWPTTRAVVLSSSIRIMAGGVGAARSHMPVIKYKYRVNGVERVKDAFSHGMTMGGGRGWAEKIIARYPVGATIDVSYNPDNPEETSIETALGFLGWALVVMAALFVLGATSAAGLI
jgi:hypothetical protein